MNYYFGDTRVAAIGDAPTFMEKVLNAIFHKKEIVNCDKDIYLHRWYVFRTKWLSLFIHKFVRSDEDRALHDHPWPFLVIPIWRGYIEHSSRLDPDEGDRPGSTYDEDTPRVPVQNRVYPIIGSRIRPATYRHRVELFSRDVSEHTEAIIGRKINRFKPSWSIFFHFRKLRPWGFWMPEGWINHAKFWTDKCE